jgi:hypothetical protein
MKIPAGAVIATEKLTKHLLVPRPWDDKSKFLGFAGFDLANWTILEAAIRELASTTDASENGVNDYGTFWRSEGELVGPRGELSVVVIWLQWAVDGTFHFVTLKPRRETS